MMQINFLIKLIFQIFIELLSFLEKRFIDATPTQRYLLYDTFINGIKLHKIEKYLGNIF